MPRAKSAPKKRRKRRNIKGTGAKKTAGRSLQALALLGAATGDKTSREAALPLLLGSLALGGIGELLVQLEKREDRKKRGSGIRLAGRRKRKRK